MLPHTSLLNSADTISEIAEKSAPLRQSIEQALARTGYPELRAVRVGTYDGLVTLTGCVPTYYLKQLAQCAAGSIEGVDGLQNNIVVAVKEGPAPVGRDLHGRRFRDVVEWEP